MSSGTDGTNGTLASAGPKVIQTADFYVHASLLHPIIVGSIAVVLLFIFLRLISNRSIAPMNVFDWLANVALGSTLAGIINGNSLVRGLLGLTTILSFQIITSSLGSRFHRQLGWLLVSPPLLIAFRGQMLRKVMMSHRVSVGDFYAALRQKNMLSLEKVECVFIEANGSFSIYTIQEVEDTGAEGLDVLMEVSAYKALYEDAETKQNNGGIGGEGKGSRLKDSNSKAGDCDDTQNEIAGDAA